MVVKFPTQPALPECAHLLPMVPYAVRDADNAQAALMDELLSATCASDVELIRREAQRIWLSFAALESSALERLDYITRLRERQS